MHSKVSTVNILRTLVIGKCKQALANTMKLFEGFLCYISLWTVIVSVKHG